MGVRRLDRVGGTATILVTDLVGSTAMFDRLGDDKAERLLRAHLGELRDLVRSFGGVEVKSTGDGIMAAFPAAWLASECAVAMQRALHLRNESRTDDPLRIRIGLHSGDTTADRHDYYGIAVAVAARLCDKAPPDGILLSGVTRGLVGSRGGHAYTDAGVPALKGIDEPVQAYSLEWGPGQLPPATPPGLESKRGPLIGAAAGAAVLALGGVFIMARGDEPPRPPAPVVAGGEVVRVSVRANGDETTRPSSAGEISGAASHVVFESAAKDLVAADRRGFTDVFHVELEDGHVRPRTLRLVSSAGGVQGDGDSGQPSISHDGNVVGFLSEATNLAGRLDANKSQDIFMHVIDEGATSRVSISSEGVAGNDRSFEVDVSANGDFIAFTTAASNLSFQEDLNEKNDIFVRDVELEKTNRANIQSETLNEANRNSSDPSISGGGEYVAFASPADTLSLGDTNNASDVFRYNRDLHQTVRASIPPVGEARNAAGQSSQPSISDDGTRIAFVSTAQNLVDEDASADPDVFVYDFVEKETILVTPAVSPGTPPDDETANPVISGDGRWVAFESTASNLVEGDTNGVRDIFLSDLDQGEKIVRVSIDEDEQQVFDPSFDPSISEDGSFVTFASEASLVRLDTNGVLDVYLRGPLY